MLFHSLHFIIFFLAFLIGWGFLQGRMRSIYVLLASYVFYSWWYLPYVLVLFGLSSFAYFSAFYARRSRLVFTSIVVIAFLPLCIFKYTGFAIRNIRFLTESSWGTIPEWQLPLGISFITFTVIAYLVDVRRGETEAVKDPLQVLLYFSFFPQLIAGPIMRPHELFGQLKALFFKKKLLCFGLLMFAIGVVKKMVFANQLGALVDEIYNLNAPLSFQESLLALYGFPVQIYCDFSGYTDMAIGLAMILGVKLPLNFNRPYAATSIRDFWRRWHMTLSRWLRDYLYIPLGGSRQNLSGICLALLITMTLGGLWHGAAWTFVIWGIFHAVFLILEHVLKDFKPFTRVPNWLKCVLTFHIVTLGWILFRAENFSQVGKIFSGLGSGFHVSNLSRHGFEIGLILACLALHRFDSTAHVEKIAKRFPVPIVAISLALILASHALNSGNPGRFIYFDF